MPDDELTIPKAAALIAKVSGWPMSRAKLHEAAVKGTIAAEHRPVPGRADGMWFIRTEEARRYAEHRASQPRRGPLTKKEKAALAAKAARAKQERRGDPWDYLRDDRPKGEE